MIDAAYWITMAHLPGWEIVDINKLIIKIYHENNISLEVFFQLTDSNWRNIFQLTDKQIVDLNQAKKELPNNAFLAESYLSQGYELIPITSPEYPKNLKANLKVALSPSLLYVKGNKKLLEEKSYAIIGSRINSQVALGFAENIAKRSLQAGKVIVGGLIKGADKQAMETTLANGGQCVAVLAQGINTFSSGFNSYYKSLVAGDMLVLSVFPLNLAWNQNLSNRRNSVMLALAGEIFVAESELNTAMQNELLHGIKKERAILVRQQDINEKGANAFLIANGARAVDYSGNEIELKTMNRDINDSEQIRLF